MKTSQVFSPLCFAGQPKVTRHDSCHMKRVLGIAKEPRQLIEAARCELVEMKDADGIKK
ncbi:MAG: hypothetical protein ACOYOS_11035 [Syntrophales bacterium]